MQRGGKEDNGIWFCPGSWGMKSAASPRRIKHVLWYGPGVPAAFAVIAKTVLRIFAKKCGSSGSTKMAAWQITWQFPKPV
jgi:hypothetical protein